MFTQFVNAYLIDNIALGYENINTEQKVIDKKDTRSLICFDENLCRIENTLNIFFSGRQSGLLVSYSFL